MALVPPLPLQSKLGIAFVSRSGRGGPSFSVRSEKEAKGAVPHGQRRHWYAFESLQCVRRGAQKRTASRRLKQFVRSLACKQASPLTGPP